MRKRKDNPRLAPVGAATRLGRGLPVGAVLLLALAAGGCDKCGHRVNINAPSIQHACGDQTPSPQ